MPKGELKQKELGSFDETLGAYDGSQPLETWYWAARLDLLLRDWRASVGADVAPVPSPNGCDA